MWLVVTVWRFMEMRVNYLNRSCKGHRMPAVFLFFPYLDTIRPLDIRSQVSVTCAPSVQ
jgi:hypothetical protein